MYAWTDRPGRIPLRPDHAGLAALAAVAAVAAVLALAACDTGTRAPADDTADTADTAATAVAADTADTADTAGSGSPADSGDARRLEASRRIVEFLRDGGSLDPSLLADSVTLRVAPDGGGARRTVGRERLTRRDEWWVGDYSLTPPATVTEATVRPGRHINCVETPLETRAPELARLPHVGVRLAPPEMESCLQTWNLTLVFTDDPGPPRLVAALYEQWEW